MNQAGLRYSPSGMEGAGSSPLQPFAWDVWIADGETVPFYTLPYTTRMTVIRLPGGRLFIHSPERLTAELRNAVAQLGTVTWLISPNKLHHLFLQEWLDAFPAARSYAAPGLVRKRADLRFDGELKDRPEPEWLGDIDQLIFRGSFAMEEVVFFHRPSRTLVLTDLIENFPPESLNRWHRLLAAFTGILAPNGHTPIDWRLSFTNRRLARVCLERMLAWQPERIILSHGLCIEADGTDFLMRSFRWLGK